MASLPIVDDILDRILTFLPDFKSLYACILVSSAFYNIYARHPKSICHRVASNIVGPVDAALDFIRFPYTHEEPRLSYFNKQRFPVRMFLDVPIIVEKHDLQTFYRSDIQELESLGKLADNWEDDFCLRWKDRRPNAYLTPLESSRFRRAVFRLALFHKAFEYVGVADEFGINVDLSPSEIQQMFQARVSFLDQLSSEELYQMQVFATYMTQIRAERGGYDETSPDEQLSYGPSELYRLLGAGYDLDTDYEGTFQIDVLNRYFFVPLEAALDKRGAKPLPADDNFLDSILDQRFEHDDSCAHCGLVRRLWNQSRLGCLHKTSTIFRLSL